MAAENMLSGALRQLFALSENYPNLKANANFQQLQTDLSDIENKIAAARRFYNNAVQEYNTGIQQFPAALFAGMFGFGQRRSSTSAGPRASRADAAREVLRRGPARHGEAEAMAAYGLYTHIQSNKRRSIALLIGLFFLVYLLVFAGALLGRGATATMTGRLNYLLRAAQFDFIKALPFATVGTVLWILIAYKFHQRMIDAVTDAHEVSRTEEPRLYNLLENLCISRGITMPKLRVADDDALNAFATGLNEKQYSITVTRGLINALNDREFEAVLGHELTHIRNGDVRMLVIAVVIAGVISFFGETGLPRLLPERVLGRRPALESRRRQGRRRHRDRHRAGDHRVGLDFVDRHPLRAVASARISRRFRLGRARQRIPTP